MLKAVIGSPVATQSGYGHHAREIITKGLDNSLDYINDFNILIPSKAWLQIKQIQNLKF